jgi:hypothetical protein
VPNANQIRFLTQNEIALVYDYFLRRWTVFDNHGGRDAEIINNNYVYLTTDNKVYIEQADYFLDAGQPISLEVDTGWMSFAGMQGYNRVYKMLALGEYKSPHKLLFKCAYNYLDVYIDEKTIDTSEFMNETTYGEVSPYGEEDLYGLSGNVNSYQIRFDMKRQKVQSLRMVIKELQNNSYGEGLSLSNLCFQIGAKAGQFKPNQAQIFGAE